jgi:N-acetylmuramoyl-L-alanine amidase
MVHRVAGTLLLACLVFASLPAGQAPAGSALTLIARDGRRTLPTITSDGQEMVALDDLATAFQLTFREDTLANGVLVTYKGRTIVLTPDQTLASVSGRLVSLPAPLTRAGRRWLVPVEFINRALTLILDGPLDLRRSSRLVVIGDARVPRVAARYEVSSATMRVTFDVQPKANQAVTLDGQRLLVRFDVEALDASLPPLPQQGFATAVHLADPPNTIVVDLGPRYSSYRVVTTPADPAVRVTLDLLPAETEPVPPSPTTPAPPPEAPAFGQPASALRIIVIDPGHGGDESGAKGAGGTLEKDVALSVARRLKATIEARLGLRVLLTREDDRAVGLDERAAIANNNKANLFVSLHANASVRPATQGAEVYYLSLDKSVDEARRRAASEAQTLPVFGGGNRDVEIISWEMAQARYIDESARLAAIVEERLRDAGGIALSARPIQQAPFRVLVGANMPAVLLEMGYITNGPQEQQLSSGAFQGAVVQALFDSIVRFRDFLDARSTAAHAQVLR